MNNINHQKYFLALVIFVSFAISGCRKDSMPPVVMTMDVTDITCNSARCSGKIVSSRGADLTELGFCWSTSQMPTIEENKLLLAPENGLFSGEIAGLLPFTTYFIRAFATNKQGTAYGEIIMICTKPIPGETVTDLNGNLYHSVKIGTQVWMLENLRTSRFSNGDSIRYVTMNYYWNTTLPKFCYYNNDTANAKTYGALYNWFAAADSRGIAPAGWHVPTQEEWKTLLDYCGGANIAGGKLKSAGTTYWQGGNWGATNETGFSALPAGNRDYDGDFSSLGTGTVFWTSTESNATGAYFIDIQYNTIQSIILHGSKYGGVSLRCIKD